jgi:hypothetical protein
VSLSLRPRQERGKYTAPLLGGVPVSIRTRLAGDVGAHLDGISVESVVDGPLRLVMPGPSGAVS